ncbi:MAG: HD domain-containing protein [Deltaproteobacteria bacterium]
MNAEASPYPHISVRDLAPGDNILQFLELRSIELRKTRSGEDYADLSAGDATGTIPGKIWPDALRKWGHDFKPGDFVKIEGRVERYREKNQLVVDKIRSAEPDEIPSMSDLVRATTYDPDTLWEELNAKARSLKPPELAELVEHLLHVNAQELKTFPAARMVHHAYKGGLIEHMVTVTGKVEAIVALDTRINRDVAIAGAILHDIGKVRELDPAQHGRTFEGRLIGHLILGVQMIHEAGVEKNFSDFKWLREVEHILVSHHGETEFGSPVRPLTREAMVVHFIDNLDSKLKIIEEALESTEPDGFSKYNRWLEGRAFIGSLPEAEEENDAAT